MWHLNISAFAVQCKCKLNIMWTRIKQAGKQTNRKNEHSEQKDTALLSCVIVCVCSVAQLCPTLCDPMDPARLLCQWDFLGKNTEVGCLFLLHGFFPTQGSNWCLLSHLQSRQILYCWATGKAPVLGAVSYKCDDLLEIIKTRLLFIYIISFS